MHVGAVFHCYSGSHAAEHLFFPISLIGTSLTGKNAQITSHTLGYAVHPCSPEMATVRHLERAFRHDKESERRSE